MAAQYCMKCGAEIPTGALFCQYCGTPIPTMPSAPPLASAVAPFAPTPSPWPEYGGPGTSAPPPRRRSRFKIIVIVVVVIIIIGIVGALLLASSESVNVTGIYFSSPDNTCGWDGASDNGFNQPLGSSLTLSYYDYNSNVSTNPPACTVHTVSTNTSGFSISGANVPLTTPANATQDNAPVLTFTVNLPNSAYNGPLYVIIT